MFNSYEAIAVYRGWQALEQTLPPDTRGEVIDFDLVPQYRGIEHFENRQQVRDRILELRETVSGNDETAEFLRAKLAASAYYLAVLEVGTSKFEFYDHVRHILGITPELIAESAITAQQAKVFYLLSEFGVAIDDGRPNPQSFQQFEDTVRLQRDQAEPEARTTEAALVPLVLNILGLDDLDVIHKIVLVEENTYWKGWALGKKGDFLLRYNFHGSQHWRRGDLEFMTLHEVGGHFVHASNLAREIERGNLDPFIGLTTVHDPSAFMAEGIADALTYFLPSIIPLSQHGVLRRESRILRDYLQNNAHILINMGERREKVIEQLLRDPFTSREIIELDLGKWLTDPLFRAYQYAYGIAGKYHMSFNQRMTDTQKLEYLRYSFNRYVTPRRLIEYAEELIRNSQTE